MPPHSARLVSIGAPDGPDREGAATFSSSDHQSARHPRDLPDGGLSGLSDVATCSPLQAPSRANPNKGLAEEASTPVGHRRIRRPEALYGRTYNENSSTGL